MTLTELIQHSQDRPDYAERRRQVYLMNKSERRGITSRYLGKDQKRRPIRRRHIAYSYHEGDFFELDLSVEELRELAGLGELHADR